MSDSPLTSPRLIAFQRFRQSCERGLRSLFSTRMIEWKRTVVSPFKVPLPANCLSRKVIQARSDLPDDSVILPFSKSTKPIMTSLGATENFVARWCSGLA